MNKILLGTGQLARALPSVSHKMGGSFISLPRACYPWKNDILIHALFLSYRLAVILNAATYTRGWAKFVLCKLMRVKGESIERLAELARWHDALLCISRRTMFSMALAIVLGENRISLLL